MRLTFEPDVEDVRTAASWPTAPGVVVESYVEAPHRVDSDGSAVVRYRYRVGGSNYVAAGHKIDTACQDEDPYEVVKRYPVGAEVDVLYKPSDPGTSALESASFDLWDRSLLWLGAASCWFGAAALAGAVASYAASRRALRSPALRPGESRGST